MRILLSLALVCAAATMAGCNTIAPIQNVSNASVISADRTPLSADQVRAAIFRAGVWIQNLSRGINVQLAST